MSILIMEWVPSLILLGKSGIQQVKRMWEKGILYIPCISFMCVQWMDRRGSVICWHSCWEEHLSHPFSLNNGENDAWCTLAYKKKIDSNSKFVTLFANTSGKGLAVMCEIVIFYMLSEQKREMRSTHWNQSSSNPHPFWRRKWYEQAANTIYSDGEEMENQTQWTRI